MKDYYETTELTNMCMVYWIKLEELLKSEVAQDMHDMIKLFTDESISEFFII